MGLTVDELKKINALSLDDHTDDTNLDKIRSELVSCDDSIRLIAKSPALTGETQDAVTQALAQLQAEVRKWHGLVASVHSQRTEARDAMRSTPCRRPRATRCIRALRCAWSTRPTSTRIPWWRRSARALRARPSRRWTQR